MDDALQAAAAEDDATTEVRTDADNMCSYIRAMPARRHDAVIKELQFEGHDAPEMQWVPHKEQGTTRAQATQDCNGSKSTALVNSMEHDFATISLPRPLEGQSLVTAEAHSTDLTETLHHDKMKAIGQLVGLSKDGHRPQLVGEVNVQLLEEAGDNVESFVLDPDFDYDKCPLSKPEWPYNLRPRP